MFRRETPEEPTAEQVHEENPSQNRIIVIQLAYFPRWDQQRFTFPRKMRFGGAFRIDAPFPIDSAQSRIPALISHVPPRLFPSRARDSEPAEPSRVETRPNRGAEERRVSVFPFEPVFKRRRANTASTGFSPRLLNNLRRARPRLEFIGPRERGSRKGRNETERNGDNRKILFTVNFSA